MNRTNDRFTFGTDTGRAYIMETPLFLSLSLYQLVVVLLGDLITDGPYFPILDSAGNPNRLNSVGRTSDYLPLGSPNSRVLVS
ncbi:hypothetical protein CRG98_014290, partial [Punica granatum]